MSNKQIQEFTYLNRATVTRALRKLRDQEMIEVIRRGNNFKDKANKYKLTIPINSGAGYQFDPKKPVTLEEIEEFFDLTEKDSSKKDSAG